MSDILSSDVCPFSPRNLGTVLITKKFINQRYPTTSLPKILDNVIDLNFGIRPNCRRLKLQSNSFAQFVMTLENLNLKDILTSDDNSFNEKLLRECFIYSYYRALLYGIYDNKKNNMNTQIPCVIGHSIMSAAIRKKTITFFGNSLYVNYSINFDENDIKFINDSIKKFPFLQGANEPKLTEYGFNWFISKYDRILILLRKELSSRNVSRLINIYDPLVDGYLSQDNAPIFNSFYATPKGGRSELKLDDWFYTFNTSYSITEGSICFGKAVFLYTKSNADCKPYFDNLDMDDELNLTRYELSAIAGGEYPEPFDDDDDLKV